MREFAVQSSVAAIKRVRVGNGTGRDSKRRGRQRSEASEEAILSAMIQLLRDKPLRDISIEEIARKAGVGKATIYKWWPSKAYVALDAFSRRLNQMVPLRDTGNAERDLNEQLCLLFAFYETTAGRLLGQFLGEGQVDEEFASLFRERFLKPRREAVGVIIDRAIERGEIGRGLDRELMLDMIYGPGMYRMMVRKAPLNRKGVEAMVSALFRGLRDGPSRATERTQ